MPNLKNEVYTGYAYSNDVNEKSRSNRILYKEIKDKAEVKWQRSTSGSSTYLIVSNPQNLSNDKLALICDSGNLCFGYTMTGINQIKVYTD